MPSTMQAYSRMLAESLFILILKGEKMEQIKDPKDICSIFKDGKQDTTAEAYTEAWIKLINLFERNKHG